MTPNDDWERPTGPVLTTGAAPKYKAWYQTRLFPVGGARSFTDRTELVAVHAVAVEKGEQAIETPCGLAVLVDVTGEDNFDLIQPNIRCEMCAGALGLCPDDVGVVIT